MMMCITKMHHFLYCLRGYDKGKLNISPSKAKFVLKNPKKIPNFHPQFFTIISNQISNKFSIIKFLTFDTCAGYLKNIQTWEQHPIENVEMLSKKHGQSVLSGKHVLVLLGWRLFHSSSGLDRILITKMSGGARDILDVNFGSLQIEVSRYARMKHSYI
jgi:hypothetical protein